MSIYQPIKLPVQIYKNTDSGAPQLSSNGGAGEIKTLLKACLKTGYGTKQAATGWDMAYEYANKAVFKSTDPRSTGNHFRIDDDLARTSQATCYKAMTDIDTGTGQWFDGRTGHLYKEKTPSVIQWRLIASPVSFLLLTSSYEASGKLYNSHLFFGDFQTTLNTDSSNCMLWSSKKVADGEYVDVYTNPFSEPNGVVCQFAKAYDQSSAGAVVSMKTLGSTTADSNPLGDLSHPAYIEESVASKKWIRGVYPFYISEKKEIRDAASLFTEKSVNGRNFLSATIGWKDALGAHSLLIPLDYWEI